MLRVTEVVGEEDEVMSEVHLGCPPGFSSPYISRFTFSIPANSYYCTIGLGGERKCYDYSLSTEEEGPSVLSVDEDGDLVLARRKKLMDYEIAIQHRITSSLPSVGLQVWKAAMLLADFILHKSITTSDLNNIVALELGAGTGIAGIILSRIARIVFLTDSDDIVLENCAANVHLNSNSFNCFDASVIKKLDWKKSWPPTTEIKDLETSGRYTYSWTSAEIEEAEGASLVLAGDVIYSDELTDSFFSVLDILMSKGRKPCNKVLYMALEKRYNFSLDDLDVVANGYSHFRSFLMEGEGCNNKREGGSRFLGEKLDISEVPQYIKEYDRGEDLELWKITYLDQSWSLNL